MNTYELAKAISRQLRGISSPEDDAMVNAWLEADPKNRALFQEMSDQGQQQNFIERLRQVDTEAALQRLYLQAKKKSRTRWLYITGISTVAAVTVLTVSYLMRSLHGIEPGKKLAPKTAVNAPAGQKAILINAAGRVELQAAGDTSYNYNGLQISQHNGVLSYREQSNQGIAQMQQVITPKGGTYRLILPDGSKAWLNADSRLVFPDRFQDQRAVELEGEGYFEIVANADQPFVLKAKGGTVIQVLGTAFNVKAYQAHSYTTLISGGVKVGNGGAAVVLRPGELASAGSGKVAQSKGNVAAAVAWKEDSFLFHDMPVREVMEELGRWYNMEIVFSEDFKEQGAPFTGEVSRRINLQELVQILEKTGIARFSITGATLQVLPYE